MISLLILTMCFMLPFASIGLFVLIKTLFMPMQAPADKSNRIAHLRLVWFSITRPELFVRDFTWLQHDEHENINNKGM